MTKMRTTINVDFASYVNEIEFELFKEKGKRLSKKHLKNGIMKLHK